MSENTQFQTPKQACLDTMPTCYSGTGKRVNGQVIKLDNRYLLVFVP